MTPLPDTDSSLLLRTDYSDDRGWAALLSASHQRSPDGFVAMVEGVSDQEYDQLTVEAIVALAAESGHRSFLFVADRTTFTHPERPVLVVDLFEQPGRTFRVVPAEMWGIENNLSIGNMDYAEFAESVDTDGIFRGFPR
jgi:uncharacterized protein DUF6924